MSFEIGHVFETKHFEKINGISIGNSSSFEILSILGHGSFGRVNEVKHIQSGQTYFKIIFLIPFFISEYYFIYLLIVML